MQLGNCKYLIRYTLDIAEYPMALFPNAASIIKRYEGFKPSAELDRQSEEETYTIGYGLNYYPDGSRVMAGQKITKKKAQEYLERQIEDISKYLDYLCLDIDENQEEALISFIHSIGIEGFESSKMLACLCDGKALAAAEEFSKWIFNNQYLVIPNMLSRRKEEQSLFLAQTCEWNDFSTQLLVECFQNYSGSEAQDMAIHNLEIEMDPYVLANFINTFNTRSSRLESCTVMV